MSYSLLYNIIKHSFAKSKGNLIERKGDLVIMTKRKLLATLLFIAMTPAFSGGVEAATELKEVIVEGERYDGDIDQIVPVASGMVGTKADVGILGNKDVLDMPVQQMTFSKDAMKTFSQPGRSIMDTLALDPSVTVTHSATDTNINIRGFSAGGGSWIMNGIPSMSHQMTMPYNFIDTVSVLSGPNIGINGVGVFMSGSVGGTVSVTSKKAQDTPNLSAGISWASDSYLTESVDWGKRFGENNEWGIRVNALNANGDLSVDGVKDDKHDIYVNIDHRAKRSKTNLLIGYDYDDITGRSNTINLGKTITSLPAIPKNTNNLSPKWSNDTYKNYTFILNHEQYLSDNLTWFANAGYRKEDYTSWLQQWSSRVLNSYDGSYTGTYTQMPVFHKYYYFNTGFKGNFMLGSLKNEWAASVDYTYFTRSRVNDVSPANKYDISGNIYDGTHSVNPNVFWDPITKQYNTKMKGWTVIDTITTSDERASFTFGWHGHSVETNNFVNDTRLKTNATAPILGLVYKITPEISFFADHTENFVEGSSIDSSYDNDDQTLPPSKTKQNEFGFKYKTGNFLHTLSFYEIKKANGISVPSDGPKGQIYALDGEQRNRGIEFSTAGDLSDKWSIIAGITYMDAKQTKTQDGKNDGRRVEALPEIAGDLALIYKPNDVLRLTGRVSYTGSELIRNSSSYTNSIKLPSTTLVDLGVTWDTHFGRQPVTLSAFCYNLFNKDYWYAAGSNSIGLGAPRTFAISADFRF